MLTVKNEQLKKQFNKYNIIPPSKKNEDWLYYDLDHLKTIPNQRTNQTTNVEKLLKEIFFILKMENY